MTRGVLADTQGYSCDGHGDISDLFGEDSGCQHMSRPGTFGPEDERMGVEHVAGPGCNWGRGYSGYQISVEEMKGCRAVQCLLPKDTRDWQPEEDDHDFERESRFFLTGVGDGSATDGDESACTPVRHGVESFAESNIASLVSLWLVRKRLGFLLSDW